MFRRIPTFAPAEEHHMVAHDDKFAVWKAWARNKSSRPASRFNEVQIEGPYPFWISPPESAPLSSPASKPKPKPTHGFSKPVVILQAHSQWPRHYKHPSEVCSYSRCPSIMEFGEGIVRWSPTKDRNQLLVVSIAGANINLLNAWGSALPGHVFQYNKQASHRDYPPITCYDWSPLNNSLVAVGTKGGDVHLLRIDDNSNDSIVLPLKLQRACQAVSFNKTGLLAVGLDRVRNDQCLQIWDVQQRLEQWNATKPGWSMPASKQEYQPIRKLEPSLPVTSTRFFEDQPQTLIAGIKNQRLTIHDLRDPDGAVLTFPTRNNNNLAIDYSDPNYFASSNLENANVTIWDKRSASSSTSKIYAERVGNASLPMGCVLNIPCALDHDKKSTIRSLRYNRDRRGMLGVLSNAGELQVLRTELEHLEHGDSAGDGSEVLRQAKSEIIVTPTAPRGLRAPWTNQVCSFDWVRLGTDKLNFRLITRGLDASLNLRLVPDRLPALYQAVGISSNKQSK